LAVGVKEAIEIIITADNRASGPIQGVRGALSSLGGLVQRVGQAAMLGIGAVATAAGAAGAGLTAMAVDAAPLADQMAAFEGITERMGESADGMLAALRDATSGMVPMRDMLSSFNLAAQLVGDDFARRLPDALGVLQQVAAATGEDMGYLMDSLVRGVGRLSPAILDNLAVQIDLNSAYQAFADNLGISVNEMTKAQQQAAVMDEVMRQLTANVGDLPDTTQGAAAMLARFRATIQDTKDRLGIALLPALTTLMGILGQLVDQFLPPLIAFFEGRLVPAFETVAGAAETFFNQLQGGATPLQALWRVLAQVFGPETADRVLAVINSIRDFGTQVTEFLAPVAEFVGENVQLSDVLVGLGVAIASVVIPALISIVSAAAPVIAVFAGVVAAVAALRAAWESDFLGIRTALTAFWENSAKPALSALWQWLQVNVPAAIQAVTQWFTGTFLPAVRNVWSFIQTNLIPLFEALGELVGTVVSLAVQVLAGIWTNVLVPAMTAVWTWISTKLQPVFETISDFISTHVAPRFQEMSASIGGVTGAIQTVIGWLRDLKAMLDNIQLPDWLQRHSPSEFEMTFIGAGEALRELTRLRLPELQTSLRATMPAGNLPLAGAVAGGGTVGGGTVLQFQYAPLISMADEREARTKMLPVLREILYDLGVL